MAWHHITVVVYNFFHWLALSTSFVFSLPCGFLYKMPRLAWQALLFFLIAGVTSLVWMSPTQGFYYDGRFSTSFHFIPKIIFTAASSY
jgi:hypothetical protein